MKRRPLPVLAAALAAAAAGSAPAHAAETWEPDVAGARAYLAKRAGTVSFAVRTPTRAYAFRGDRSASGASVVKAMLLVAYLSRGSVRDRPLRPTDRALLAPMIRRSDDRAANRVWTVVGDAGLRRVARAGAMRGFVPGGPVWGGGRITASDQARFFLRIDARIPTRHRAYAMGLLRTVVPSQRWGVGQVRPPGWTLYFKGGWGSGTGLVDHQVALLTRGGQRVAVAILTTGNPGMAYGNATLREVARRLLAGLGDDVLGEVAGGQEAALAPSAG